MPYFFRQQISKNFGVRAKILSMISSFWKSWSVLSITIKFSLKNEPISPKVQVSTSLGEGVEGWLKLCLLILDQTWLTVFDRWIVWWWADVMVWSYDDMMVWWYDDKLPERQFTLRPRDTYGRVYLDVWTSGRSDFRTFRPPDVRTSRRPDV